MSEEKPVSIEGRVVVAVTQLDYICMHLEHHARNHPQPDEKLLKLVEMVEHVQDFLAHGIPPEAWE